MLVTSDGSQLEAPPASTVTNINLIRQERHKRKYAAVQPSKGMNKAAPSQRNQNRATASTKEK